MSRFVNDTETLGSDPVTLRLSSPEEFLSAVPYLIGFHPERSLVLVGLDGSRVAVTARLDLDECGAGELGHALAVLVQAGSDSMIVALYDEGHSESPGHSGRPVIEALLDLAQWEGLRLGEVLIVRGERYWPYGSAPSSAGRRFHGASSQAAASATYAGMVARPDRATMLAVLDHDDDADRRRHDLMLADSESAAVRGVISGAAERQRRGVKRAIFAAARQSDQTLPLPDAGPGRAATLCRFAVGLTDVRVRDAVWVAVDHGRLDGRALWQEMLRAMPAPYDASPLFLFGWASWREGNGVLAAEAALRALDSNPNYSAAELLFSAIQNGLDPRTTPRLRATKA